MSSINDNPVVANDNLSTVMPIVGVEKLYVAKLIKDNIEGFEFGKTRYLAGVREIGIKPKYNSDPFFAENKLWTSEDTLESIEVEVDQVDLTMDDEAFLLGHKIATEGGIIYGEDDKAPEVAILFKSNKGNGKARYMVVYRGTFTPSDENYKSKEGKANFQTKKLKATFAPLKYNGKWRWKVDEEQGWDDKKFFEKVIMPTVKADTPEGTAGK